MTEAGGLDGGGESLTGTGASGRECAEPVLHQVTGSPSRTPPTSWSPWLRRGGQAGRARPPRPARAPLRGVPPEEGRGGVLGINNDDPAGQMTDLHRVSPDRVTRRRDGAVPRVPVEP